MDDSSKGQRAKGVTLAVLLLFTVTTVALCVCCASVTILDCPKFSSLNSEELSNEQAPFLNDNSTFTLAEAGVYSGAADVAEYVAFATPGNRFIKAKTAITKTAYLAGFNASSNECKFVVFAAVAYTPSEHMDTTDVFATTPAYVFYYRPDNNMLGRIVAYYDKPYLAWVFARADTKESAAWFCSILHKCNAAWVANNLKNKMSV